MHATWRLRSARSRAVCWSKFTMYDSSGSTRPLARPVRGTGSMPPLPTAPGDALCFAPGAPEPPPEQPARDRARQQTAADAASSRWPAVIRPAAVCGSLASCQQKSFWPALLFFTPEVEKLCGSLVVYSWSTCSDLPR